jgi:hypothetical protein
MDQKIDNNSHGGIINCFINNKKELVFDQKLIIESCLQKIAELSPNN